MMKKHTQLPLLAIFTLLCLLLLGFPSGVKAQAGTPWEVLAEINAYRASNGLDALVENQYLNIAAQNHANWIAAGNPGGHTGEGGSTSQDRAIAAGYGEGAAVAVTENWARGPGLTVSDCIYVSWNDAAHMNNMLTTWHNEFGAGVALDGSGMTVYVVNFGHVIGSAPAQATATPGGPTAPPPGPTNTLEPLIQPVTRATPNPDGSVIHIVQPGQSLWAVVDAYQISMADLLALNNLTEDSPIFPGQELLILPASIDPAEPTDAFALPETTPTPRPSPTATQRQATPTGTTPTPTETPERNGGFFANIFSGDTLWVGIGLVAVSVFGIALLLFTSSRLK